MKWAGVVFVHCVSHYIWSLNSIAGGRGRRTKRCDRESPRPAPLFCCALLDFGHAWRKSACPARGRVPAGAVDRISQPRPSMGGNNSDRPVSQPHKAPGRDAIVLLLNVSPPQMAEVRSTFCAATARCSAATPFTEKLPAPHRPCATHALRPPFESAHAPHTDSSSRGSGRALPAGKR